MDVCLQIAKGECGLDHYQVRLYRACYRHMTLAVAALAHLTAVRAQEAEKRAARHCHCQCRGHTPQMRLPYQRGRRIAAAHPRRVCGGQDLRRRSQDLAGPGFGRSRADRPILSAHPVNVSSAPNSGAPVAEVAARAGLTVEGPAGVVALLDEPATTTPLAAP